MVQSTCQPLQCLYRGFGARLSVTKDTLPIVSPQVVATFCRLAVLAASCSKNGRSRPCGACKCFFADPGLPSWAIILSPPGAGVGRSDLLFHRTFHLFQINNVLLSFRHVATEKSIAVTCYTGSVSGATSSMLPCCSRNTRWQRRANAKLWVAMREVS
jgi:hypothetical protein